MGEVPDWYPHLRAARYLGVRPWELPENSPWIHAALAAMKAEAHAADQKAKNRRH